MAEHYDLVLARRLINEVLEEEGDSIGLLELEQIVLDRMEQKRDTAEGYETRAQRAQRVLD
jgi:hypothetical protein